MKNNAEDSKKLMTPAGAMIAVIFFFLPWLKTSCGTVTGADIAKADGLIWLVFISALLIVIIYFSYDNIKKLSKAKPLVLLLSIVGLGIILLKGAELGRQLPRRSGITVGIGLIGTVIGFILAMVGAAFFKDSNPNNIIITEKDESKSQSIICPACQKQNYNVSKYCEYCGQKFMMSNEITIKTKVCPACNAKNSIDDKFCTACGVLLN